MTEPLIKVENLYKVFGRDAASVMPMIHAGKTKDEFVKFRTERDAQLAMPRLIIPSLQVNMRAGRMPEPDAQGDVFLKVPVNKL